MYTVSLADVCVCVFIYIIYLHIYIYIYICRYALHTDSQRLSCDHGYRPAFVYTFSCSMYTRRTHAARACSRCFPTSLVPVSLRLLRAACVSPLSWCTLVHLFLSPVSPMVLILQLHHIRRCWVLSLSSGSSLLACASRC